MDTTVIFYNNSSNPNVINKSISTLGTFECKIKEPINIERPEILLSGATGNITANYCYIADLGRYYFCHSELERGQLVRFVCDISDPLMSFKSAILSSPAVIARNPWKYDKYIHDSKLPVESRTIRSSFKFPNTGLFDGQHNCYILTTIGPGGT